MRPARIERSIASHAASFHRQPNFELLGNGSTPRLQAQRQQTSQRLNSRPWSLSVFHRELNDCFVPFLCQKSVVCRFQSPLGPVIRFDDLFYRSAGRRRSMHVDLLAYLLLLQHVSSPLRHRVQLNFDAARRFGGERETTDDSSLLIGWEIIRKRQNSFRKVI